MGTDKDDTDPSSPSAMRPSQPTGRAATARAMTEPRPGQPTTDPGLGPTSVPPPASTRRPMSVTVPAPSVRPRGPNAITPPEMSPIPPPVAPTLTPTPSSIKDSVELLLEGMAGPRPDRRKTTPQSDGEASASYHAEHGVRRARTSEPAGPKVVVDRPVPGALSPGRPASPGLAPPGSQEALSTFVPARVLRRRVAMAVVAGTLFVLLSFVALRLTGRHEVAAAVPAVETPIAPAQMTASPVEAPAPTATEIVSMPTIAPPGAPAPGGATAAVEPAHNDDLRAAAHAPTGATTRHHHAEADPGRPRPSGDAPAATGDLGEFKSKF